MSSTQERTRAVNALVLNLRQEHAMGSSFTNAWCWTCGDRWPCLPAKAADALEGQWRLIVKYDECWERIAAVLGVAIGHDDAP